MKFIALLFIVLKIREMEATAQGQIDALPMVRCEETRNRIVLAHLNALAEIDRLKAEYRKLLRGRGIRAVTNVKGGAA